MNTHEILTDLVNRITCKPGWAFRIQVEDGHKILIVSIPVVDSRDTGITRIDNYFPVPEATYNMKSWRRWIFECCRKVEDHELGEWFIDGKERPFAPLHAPGADPYVVRELSTDDEVNTNQQGMRELNKGHNS